VFPLPPFDPRHKTTVNMVNKHTKDEEDEDDNVDVTLDSHEHEHEESNAAENAEAGESEDKKADEKQVDEKKVAAIGKLLLTSVLYSFRAYRIDRFF
jgi:hypothetical protein